MKLSYPPVPIIPSSSFLQRQGKRFLWAASVATLAAAPLSVATAENLLSNGGFEEWAPEPKFGPNAAKYESDLVPVGWIADSTTKTAVRGLVAKDSTAKHSGAVSVRLEAQPGAPVVLTPRLTGPSSDQWLPGPMTIAPGKKYLLRAWIKGENVVPAPSDPNLTLYAVVGGGGDFFGGQNNNRIVAKGCYQNGTWDWTPLEVEFETSSSEVAVFVSFTAVASGKIWVDDIELVPVP